MNTTESSIYLDYAATTPTDPEVAEAMLPYLSGPLSVGNASSIHRFGRQARAAVDEARDSVARLIQGDYAELYFTGSGTEADNLALLGTMQSAPAGRNHLVVSAIEHHAILHTAHYLQKQGYAVTTVPCDSEGLISPEDVAEAMTDQTALVSIMHANNEIGTIQPIAEFAQIAHARGAKFHTDAVQSAGMLPVDVRALDCDLLSLCAHKIYGPKGAGALYIRQGIKVSPQIHGGAQEREKRAGTENVAALVGFGKAAELSRTRRDVDTEHIAALRDQFFTLLRAAIPDLILNGHPTLRLPNNVNVSVPGAEGTTLLMNLDRKGVAASSGSACSSGSLEPSHVLKAIGLADTLASSGVRFSLGRTTTETEVLQAAEIFAAIVNRLRRPR
ncbi:MAG: Cysteine sulfinate desulfinase/cysteine desulfurase [Chthonomonadales bacterium]|nr:Cysteine sulfinate desulfinase/cysteine desulfurase [Chthonomonadales bacterium]